MKGKTLSFKYSHHPVRSHQSSIKHDGRKCNFTADGFISEKIKILPCEKFVLDKMEAEEGVFHGHFSLSPRSLAARHGDCVGGHHKMSAAQEH